MKLVNVRNGQVFEAKGNLETTEGTDEMFDFLASEQGLGETIGMIGGAGWGLGVDSLKPGNVFVYAADKRTVLAIDRESYWRYTDWRKAHGFAF